MNVCAGIIEALKKCAAPSRVLHWYDSDVELAYDYYSPKVPTIFGYHRTVGSFVMTLGEKPNLVYASIIKKHLYTELVEPIDSPSEIVSLAMLYLERYQ